MNDTPSAGSGREDPESHRSESVEPDRAESALRESEERQAFLLKLSDAIRSLADPLAIQEAACRLLGEHLGVDGAQYGELDLEREIVSVAQIFFRDNLPSHVGEHDLRQFPAHAEAWIAGRSLAVEDVEADTRLSEGERAGLLTQLIRASLTVPLLKGGVAVAVISTLCSAPRRWRQEDVDLLQEVANRTWEAIERAHAEAALRESEEKFMGLFAASPAPFLILKPDAPRFTIVDVNQAYLAATMRTRDEVVGRGVFEAFPDNPDAPTIAGVSTLRASFERVLATHRSDTLPGLKYDVARPDGTFEERWWSPVNTAVLDNDGDVKLIIHNAIDVTNEHRAEAMLCASEERQAFLLRLSDTLRAETDARSIAMTAVKLLAEHLGLDRAYVARVDETEDMAEIGPEYRRPDLAPVEGVLTLSEFPEAFAQVKAKTLILNDTGSDPSLSDQDRRSFAMLEMRALVVASARKGALDPVWALLVATTEPRSWTPGEVALIEEATERTWAMIERARAEVALRESEQRYRSLFETMGQGYVLLELIRDADGRAVDHRMLRVNPALGRLIGVPAAECEGRTSLEVVPTMEPRVTEMYDRVARLGRPEHFEQEIAELDRWYGIWAYPAGGDRLSVLFEDITKRKRAEAALLQSEARQAFLLELSDAIRAQPDEQAIGVFCTRKLAEHLRADRCYFATFRPEEDGAFVGPEYHRPDLRPISGDYRLSDFPEAVRRIQTGTLVFDDVARDPHLTEADKAALAAIDFGAYVASAARKGDQQVLWALAVASATPRAWTRDEVMLLEEITERTWVAVESARIGAALRKSEDRYRTMFRSMDEGYFLADVIFDEDDHAVDIAYVEANPAAVRMVGADLAGRRLSEVSREYEDYWCEIWGRVARTGKGERLERYSSPEGRWYDFYIFKPEPDKHESRRIAVCFQDVTSRKHAEQVLCEGEARQAFMLKLSDALRPLSDPLAIQEATSRALQEHMNVDWARYSELDFERQIIFNIRDFGRDGLPSHVDEYDMRQFPVHMAAWRAGRSLAIDDVEADTILSDGERSRLLEYGIRAMLATPLAKKTMAVAVISAYSIVPRCWTDGDIALLEETADRTWGALERAHAEVAQWESEARYRHLFETIPVGFGVVEMMRDEKGHIVEWSVREFNPALERHIGLDPTTTVGQRVRDVLADVDLDESAELLQDVVDNRRCRYVEIHADKIDRWLAITASPLDGDHIGLIFEDITDRKQAEQARREREERQAFLLKLGDALRAELDPETIGVLATHMLAEYMRVDRSYICRLSRDRNRAWIGPEYHAPGVASIAGEYRLADFPASMQRLETEPLMIHDLLKDPACSDLDKQSIGAMGMQAVFTGMMRKGERNHLWALVVGHSRPRIWTDSDRMLVEAAAERTWAAVARARVEVVLHENEARYRSVVESATDGIWLADRDGRFIEVNAAGCRMLGYSPEQYRQLGIRDLIEPNEGSRLHTLLEILEQGGQSTDTWSIRHADGHYVPIESSQCFTPAGYWQIIGRDVSERQRIERDLQQRSEQFVTLLRESPMGVYLVDPDLRIRVINPAVREAAGGGSDLAGYDFDSAMHDVWSHDFADELVWRVRHTLATGESYFTPERLERRGDDTAWYAWHIHRTAIPGDGDGVVCYLSDVTNQVRARERQKLLLMEVNHRVKNTLATVQSIVAQSLHNASTLEEGAAALEARLISLSSAHNVLVHEHWEGGDLHEVVRNTLAAYPEKAGDSRFRVSGVDVRLQPKAVVTLSMALHELATNAVKYGALSEAHGHVDINWEIDDAGKAPNRRFRLRWSEHDGPPVHAPENRGFGSRLIERGLAMDMSGEAHLDFDPKGLICTIDAPLDEISGEARWD